MKFWDRGIMVVTGCSRVSPGCLNCWSEKNHVIRSAQSNPKIKALYPCASLTGGRFNGNVQCNLYLLEQAAKVKKPQVYAIWNDLYHHHLWKSQVQRAMDIMATASQHTFLIVTKRPENAARALVGAGRIPEHIWHIATCENQIMAAARIPSLLQIPGKRGIIIEPALSDMDLWPFMIKEFPGTATNCFNNDIHQVIMGAETGHGARPMDQAWARGVRNQCAAAGVPFYLKTLGAGFGRSLDGVEHNELAWKEGLK